MVWSPTVLNFVLLVVILVVVISLMLTRIPGLIERIFGPQVLEGQLHPELSEGRALHIKFDPSGTEIHELHLTNQRKHLSEDKAYFMIKEFPQHKCTIFATDEEYYPPIIGPRKIDDISYIYYVKPGAILQDGCGSNFKECIREKGYIVEENCTGGCAVEDGVCGLENECLISTNEFISVGFPVLKEETVLGACSDKFNVIDCRSRSLALILVGLVIRPTIICSPLCNNPNVDEDTSDPNIFRNTLDDWEKTKFGGGRSKCANPGVCFLAKREGDKYRYEFRYGVICDEDEKEGARWVACTPKKTEKADKYGANDKPFICKQENGVFVWVEAK